ncbi:MAG: DUF2061 domain-containing protein [Crocinitomicaceae bacterium]|nr:DUF2061 domain-containing protein [Crocinitomicaceae bacterium]
MLLDQILLKRGIRRGDSAAKSLLKTISWRAVGTLDTMMIAYILTGEFGIAFSIGSVEVFTKMILYYLHERAWNKYL